MKLSKSLVTETLTLVTSFAIVLIERLIVAEDMLAIALAAVGMVQGVGQSLVVWFAAQGKIEDMRVQIKEIKTRVR